MAPFLPATVELVLFAITLGLGIITSVFTAIFVTRLMIVIWFGRTRPKTIEV